MGSVRKADGFALIDMLFVVGIIGVLSAIAVPQMTLARQSATSASALASLRGINSAQLTFALTCGGGFYAPDLPTLGTKPPGAAAAFLPVDLSSGASVEKSSYLIQVAATPLVDAPASCNGLAVGQAAPAYRSGADPLLPTNTRFFASNAGGVIFEHTASIYGAMPEIGNPAVGHPINK
jgi:type II secretory pathway pseudopilin PulG